MFNFFVYKTEVNSWLVAILGPMQHHMVASFIAYYIIKYKSSCLIIINGKKQ